MLGSLSFWDLLIISVGGVLIFGKQLPEVSRSVGKMIMDLKNSLQGLKDTVKVDLNLHEMGAPRAARPAPVSKPTAAIMPMEPPRPVLSTAPKFRDVPIDTNAASV